MGLEERVTILEEQIILLNQLMDCLILVNQEYLSIKKIDDGVSDNEKENKKKIDDYLKEKEEELEIKNKD